MEAIIDQVQALADKADEAERVNLLNALQQLQFQVESPQETFLRLYNTHLQVAVIYVGVALGLFAELAKEKTALTVTVLAERSGASSALVERILRYLASTGYVANVGPDQYKASKATYSLAHPAALPGCVHMFDICSPAIQAYPSFLEDNKYQDITGSRKTPFQKGFRTDLAAFEFISQQPKLFTAMQQVMTVMQSSDWLGGSGLLEDSARAVETEPLPQERPFFVDVGGGHGHQLVQLRDKYPHLKGHLVLQDLPQAVEQLPPIDGVKAIAQDFFEKQSTDGAKFYYLRHVLHDWPDAECVKILQNLAAVLRPDSFILIDEIVLADVGAHWQAAMRDMTMGIIFGGKERTKSQWRSLVQQAGLHLVQIDTYNVTQSDSLIVLALP